MDLTNSVSPSLTGLLRKLVLFAVVCALATACALTAPVQEMSNARQTIQAAKEANAMKYAPNYLKEAEDLMKAASEALDTGDYYNARELALAAQQQASKARQQALSRQKDVKN